MKQARPLDVVVAGDLFFDLVMSGFESWPCPGEESFAKSFYKEAGGGAAITACGLSKLGLQTGVVGVVGKNDGLWILQQLQSRGVNTSGIRFSSAEPTAFTVSVSTNLDRTFLTYKGANAELPAIISQGIVIAELTRSGHVHLAHALDPAIVMATFRAIKDKGWSLSVDVGWHPAWYRHVSARDALKLADLFFPNEREAEAITGETDPLSMLRAFQQLDLQRVALKLGPAGAALLWDGDICFQKPGGIKSVDTTGAGDCFDAGFLYAWLRGMEPGLCLKVATACGELSTSTMGGIRGFPSREELESHLCSVK